MRRKLQPGSQRGRFRPSLTWRRPLSALKCRPRPSRGRDAPPSVVGSRTWQVRVSKHPGPGESQESGGGGGGCGAAGRRGRLCVGGERSGLGPDPGLRGPRTTRGCGALPAERGRGHRPARPWRSWSWWRPMLRVWDHFILSFAPPAVAQLLVDSEGGASDPDRRRGYKV